MLTFFFLGAAFGEVCKRCGWRRAGAVAARIVGQCKGKTGTAGQWARGVEKVRGHKKLAPSAVAGGGELKIDGGPLHGIRTMRLAGLCFGSLLFGRFLVVFKVGDAVGYEQVVPLNQFLDVRKVNAVAVVAG